MYTNGTNKKVNQSVIYTVYINGDKKRVYHLTVKI